MGKEHQHFNRQALFPIPHPLRRKRTRLVLSVRSVAYTNAKSSAKRAATSGA